MLDSALILDNSSDSKLPLHFSYTGDFELDNGSFNTKGLEKLNTMGSAQYHEKQLREVLLKYPEQQIVFIDLRQESHWLLDGMPFSWANKSDSCNAGKTYDAITLDEQSKAQVFNAFKKVFYYEDNHDGFKEDKRLICEISHVETEKEMIARLGCLGVRYHIQDHRRPTDQQVEDFLGFLLACPDSYTVYFHCKGGKGRRTTFSTMLDIVVNAQEVSFEDIIHRQGVICGKDLSKLDYEPDEKWKEHSAKERYQFLKNFHAYFRLELETQMSWTRYVEEHLRPDSQKPILTAYELAEHLPYVVEPSYEQNSSKQNSEQRYNP